MNRMRINKFVPLTIIPLFFFIFRLQAQTSTNTAILQDASRRLSLKEKQDYQTLLTVSKKKGWPLIITNKAGHRAILSGIDPKGYPLYVGSNDLVSAATIRTNSLWPGGSTGLNLSGSSNNMKGKIGEWDEDSVRPNHQELVGRILQKDHPAGLSDHSTHVAGIMLASGVNPGAKGMSFGAQQLIAYDFNNHLSEMSAESPNLLVSNHSYGTIAGWNFNSDQNRWEFWGNSGDTADYKFGYYSTEAQVWDSIAYNAPFYLIVKSAGNNRDINGPAVGQPYWRFNPSGVMVSAGNRPAGISNNDSYDIMPTYSTAKNILTVGAAYPIPSGYSQPSDVTLAEFSSWGPTDDGRIKPDVVSDGINVLSSIASANDAYAYFSGTSMASPAATGSGFLLQEYWSKLHGGAFMRSATLKGLIIHTADETGVSQGPDYQYGWGLMNMQKAASVITSNNTDQLIFENNLANGTSFSVPVTASGKGPLTATITWTDPAGTVNLVNLLNNPAPKLVNDLDLRISNTDSTFMPWILDPKNPGAPATTGDNTLDNVEKVEIDNIVPGQNYTIKVSHKGTLARGQQAYSLIVSGVGGQAYCVSGPTSSAGTRIDTVTVGGFSHANVPGCTTYSNFTNLTVPIESNQSIPFSIKLSSCDASSASKVAKIFIDYNNNGNFTDAGENVATSTVINGVGTFSGNFITPAGLTLGNYTMMRIVVVETNNPANVNPCGTYGNGETQDYRVQIVKASNDIGITQLVDPQSFICAIDTQRVTVRIKNFGTSPQINFPISTTVKNGGNVISNLNLICPDSLPALGEVIFTFQAPFKAVAGNSYSIISRTNLNGDQDSTNDQDSTTILVSNGGQATTGSAEICSTNPNSVSLKANVKDSNDVAVWYDAMNSKTPIAGGNLTTTTVIPSDKTYYMALNDVYNLSTGPVNKMVLPSGGYNAFSGNFVKFSNSVPLTIQSARLYIASPGKINFIVGDIVNYNASNGSYSYFPISSSLIDVYPTTPNPQSGQIDGNFATDTGAVFYLNLPVPTTGNHAIIIDCQDGANIFRNNNISPNPYPFAIPGVFSINGNSAVNPSNTADTTFYRKYYYFFYDLTIQLVNCPSPRVPVVANTATPPTITLNDKTLTSSSAIGNQWYLNDSAIAGATGQSQLITLPGAYKDVVTDANGCTLESNQIVYTAGSDIGLTVGPNPNSGQFKVQFFIAETANVSISLLNVLGQRVYSSEYPDFSGVFSNQVDVENLSAGIYILKIQVGSKTYAQKLLIK